jgi:hypothetical protein
MRNLTIPVSMLIGIINLAAIGGPQRELPKKSVHPAGPATRPAADGFITPIPDAQAIIGRIDRSSGDSARLRAVADFIDFLDPLWADKTDVLVQQVVYYVVKHPLAKGEEDYVIPYICRHLQVQPGEALHALRPYLNTDDPYLQRTIAAFVAESPSEGDVGIERRFEATEGYLDGYRHEPPPKLLVKLMYSSDPDAALSTMSRELLSMDVAAERQAAYDILQDRHVVMRGINEDRFQSLTPVKDRRKVPEVLSATAVLVRRSKDDRWWVRLYVVEMLCHYPVFRNAELVDRLAKDDNAEVRRVAEKIQHDQAKHEHHDQ